MSVCARSRVTHLSGCVVCIMAAATAARANDRVWDQPAFGTFNFGTSWLGGVAPTVQDRAVFGHTLTTTFNPITCQFLQSTQCASVVVESGAYSFVFANPGVSVHLTGDQTGNGSGDIVVGDRLSAFDPGLSTTASLSMAFDGQLTAHGVALGWGGSGFGSRSSTLNISGASTRVTTRVGMVVGGAIPSTGKSASAVNITDGAWLRTADVGGGNYVNGTASIIGAGSRWDNNGQLSMGGTVVAPAQLNIAGGGYGRVGYIAIIGGDENGPANVNISDADSLFDVTAGIWLGNGSGTGTGTMTVSNGGRVQVDTDVSVGRGGSAGFLTVESGGRVQSGFGFIGCFQNAPGVARINGVGSRWNMTGGLVLGRESAGRVEILGGGAMSLGTGISLGYFAGVPGELLVHGIDSSLTSGSDTIVVGNAGIGTLTVEDHAHATVSGVVVAAQAGSSGSVVVRRQGRLDVTGGLVVGDQGQGSVSVTEGGVVSTGGQLRIGLNQGSNGAVSIASGDLVAPSIVVGGSGALTLSSAGSRLQTGVCDVENGGTLDLGYGGIVEGLPTWDPNEVNLVTGGTLRGSGSMLSVVNVGAATIAPGNSAGSISMYALGLSPESRLLFEIGGPSPGTDFDVVHITGDYANLNGTLELSSLNGFVPSPGQSFNILHFAEGVGATGGFTQVIDHTGFGFTFAVVPGESVGRLTATVPAPAATTVLGLGGLFAGRRRRSVRPT